MYEWRSHTAEVELHVRAPSEEQVFHATMSALAELFGSATGERQVHELELEAGDRGGLLVAWVEELLFLAETEGFVPEDAEIVACNTRLRATVRGRVGDPSPLVKAATYQGLEFAPSGDVWQARLILDV
jgi:SHS2 domain-containing protein